MPKKTEGKGRSRQNFTIRLHPAIRAKLDKIAEVEHRSRAQVIKRAILAYPISPLKPLKLPADERAQWSALAAQYPRKGGQDDDD